MKPMEIGKTFVGNARPIVSITLRDEQAIEALENSLKNSAGDQTITVVVGGKSIEAVIDRVDIRPIVGTDRFEAAVTAILPKGFEFDERP